MNALKAHLVRAVCDWALEQGFTPYVVVYAAYPGVQVPDRFVQDGRVVLNVHPQAVHRYLLNDDGLSFSARFGGKPFDIECPIAAVRAIYARENGQGVAFPEAEEPAAPDPQSSAPTPTPRKGPVLKRIK